MRMSRRTWPPLADCAFTQYLQFRAIPQDLTRIVFAALRRYLLTVNRADPGLALTKLVIVAAVAAPIGVYAFHQVQTAVRNETLRTDVRNAVNIEAICNQDRNGVGYSAGSNMPERGGAFVITCAGVAETVRASAGNEITISVASDGGTFSIVGYQRATGLRLRYDSSSDRWS